MVSSNNVSCRAITCDLTYINILLLGYLSYLSFFIHLRTWLWDTYIAVTGVSTGLQFLHVTQDIVLQKSHYPELISDDFILLTATLTAFSLPQSKAAASNKLYYRVFKASNQINDYCNPIASSAWEVDVSVANFLPLCLCCQMKGKTELWLWRVPSPACLLY